MSPDGRARARVADDGVIELTSTDGTVRIGDNRMAISASDQISISTGKASIVLKKDGSIALAGTSVTIDGGGAVQVKSGGDVTVKGSKIGGN